MQRAQQSLAALLPRASTRPQAASRSRLQLRQTRCRTSFWRHAHHGSASELNSATRHSLLKLCKWDAAALQGQVILLLISWCIDCMVLMRCLGSLQRLQCVMHKPGDSACACQRQEAHPQGESCDRQGIAVRACIRGARHEAEACILYDRHIHESIASELRCTTATPTGTGSTERSSSWQQRCSAQQPAGRHEWHDSGCGERRTQSCSRCTAKGQWCSWG